MNSWYNVNFQDAASPSMEWLIMFHDYTLFINILITMLILTFIFKMFINSFTNSTFENQTIEFIWTSLPMIMLIFLAIPSMKILYMMDSLYIPSLTIKCIGHQWYWTAEYPDFSNSFIELYMNKSMNLDTFRLLDTTSHINLPLDTQIRILTTSEDVIHSLTIPAMGMKIDSIPGRLNQVNLNSNRPGIFFGQCSEICGANHSFMPLSMEITNSMIFIDWIKNNLSPSIPPLPTTPPMLPPLNLPITILDFTIP